MGLFGSLLVAVVPIFVVYILPEMLGKHIYVDELLKKIAKLFD